VLSALFILSTLLREGPGSRAVSPCRVYGTQSSSGTGFSPSSSVSPVYIIPPRSSTFIYNLGDKQQTHCWPETVSPQRHEQHCVNESVKKGDYATQASHFSCRLSDFAQAVVSDYGLDDQAIGVRSPAGAKDFSSILCVQTGSGAHPASCTICTEGPFPGAKRGRGVTLTTHPHLVPRSRMSRSYTSSPPKRLYGVYIHNRKMHL
jgi:hypothetical protein